MATRFQERRGEPLKAPTSWWIGKTRDELHAEAHDPKNLDRMRRGVSYWSGLLPQDEPKRSQRREV